MARRTFKLFGLGPIPLLLIGGAAWWWYSKNKAAAAAASAAAEQAALSQSGVPQAALIGAGLTPAGV